MTGFQHDPLADVNLIADNLRDRYKDRFSILKELLQNADDARAEEIRFGVLRGIPGSAHPLLRGPGLVVINDGIFKESDYTAILRFGLNEKAAEPATIGKFGLGMKSVFHFSEAFLFMAETEGSTYRELVSPWGEAFHSDWGLSEEEWDQLRRDALFSVCWSSASKPFILYLPLRQEAQLRLPDGRIAGAIIEDYAGDTGAVTSLLEAEDTGHRLAVVLPLLRSLRAIQVYLPGREERAPEIRHDVELESGAVRPLRQHQDGDSVLSSKIAIASSGTAARRLRFIGSQRFVLTEGLAQIRESAAWPGSWVRDAAGKPSRAPDKAQPHAAAVFGQESQPGWMTIRWAVFLPIEEHEERVVVRVGGGGYSLALHGHFFVDAGRNGLYGLDADIGDDLGNVKDEAWVRRRWNQELASGATLDLVIPALDDFAKEVGLSEERASALASALGTSKLWSKWKQSIAANHKWIRTIEKTGPRWKKISDEATLPIPEPPVADPSRPWRVFPKLDDLGDHVVLFDPAARNLVASDKELGQWDEEQVADLIDGVNAGSAFSSSTDAEYLASFLEAIREPVRASDTVQDALCGLLRRGAASTGLQGLRAVAARIQRIAALVHRDRKLRINLRQVAIAEFLVQQPTRALVWPKELDSFEDAGMPAIEDVECLLVALASRTDHAEARRQYAEYLLTLLTHDDRRALLSRVRSLPILTAFDCRLGQKTSVSAEAVQHASVRRVLFRTGQGRNDQATAGLGLILQRVLPDESLLVVNTDLATLVLDEAANDIPVCDARAVLHCLAHQPRKLGSSEHRRELLRQVRLPDGDAVAVRGLRVLLHAQEQYLESDAHLWVERSEHSPAWRKVWSAAVGPAERWTAVETELASEVPLADWTAIGLYPIVPDEVVRLVTDRGVAALADLRLSGEEYDAILACERWEASLWKRLPFHETTKGTRIAIVEPDTCLEQPGMDLPKDLLARATLIVRSSDGRLASIQDRNIEKLDYAKAILIAIADTAPHRWCEFILDSLDRSSPPSVVFLRSISDKPWLRLESGRAVKPADFIVLPELENQVAEIAANSQLFGTPSLLPVGIRDHRAFARISGELFARSNSLSALARMVRERNEFAVGELTFEERHVPEIAALLKNAPQECPAVGWRMVAGVCDNYGADEGSKILRSILLPITLANVWGVLQWLPDEEMHPGAASSFAAYLSLLVKLKPDRESLRGLRLRACDGSWQPASELCEDVPGVAKSAVLCQEHGDLLKPLIDLSRNESWPAAITISDDRPTPEVVRTYFMPWLQRGGLGPQVGALLTLLSGENEVRNYATTALLPHTQEWLLNEIPWRIIEPLPFGGSRQPFDGLTLEQAIAQCPLRVRVVNVEHISVLSLLGEIRKVPAEKKPSQLLVGRPHAGKSPGRTAEIVQFRDLDISLFSDFELSGLLRRTAEDILRLVYFQGVSLTRVWNDLDRTEQFDVKVAERLILDNLPFYLRQLKPQNAPALMILLRKVEEQRRLIAEYEGRPTIAEEKRKAFNEALNRLRDTLKRSEEVQSGVLEAVREKLRDSYQLSSIPFELFQNADDAQVQLDEIMQFAQISKPGASGKFVVVQTGDTLSFLHWGRPINWIGSHGFDGRDRGYDRDLEKMLILSSSEKQLTLEHGTPAPVTGKFGLGFKTVLLACDRPLISSGNLQVEIVGGILPRSLSREEAQPLRKLLETHGTGNTSTGTLVQMPGIPQSRVMEVVSEFLKCAGYLCAFGLAIRQIKYLNESGSYTASWMGTTVGGLSAIQHGKLPARSLTESDTLSALRIQLEAGAVLFGLSPSGIVALPKGTPGIWVTGPTREDEHSGFAVCAMFDVDPGRVRLSGTEHRNLTLAENLGYQLGNVLRSLRDANWNEVHRDAGLSGETGEYEFWNSLWSLFQSAAGRTGGGSREMIRRLVETACKEIAGDLKVVPNGLPADLKALTTANSVHHRLAGVLTVSKCITPLFGWQTWIQRGHSQHDIVSAGVADGLRGFGFPALPSLSLSTISSWLSGETVRPGDARVLGEVLKGLPKESDRGQDINQDLEDAKKTLASVRFYSQARTTERAVDLLASVGRDDESLRAAFAPEDRRLATDYDESAISFFKFCRKQMDAPAEELAEWAFKADQISSRRATLEYLLNGDLRTEMQECVRNEGVDGTWLGSLSESDAWAAGLPVHHVDELRYRILPRLDQLRAFAAPVVIVRRTIQNPREALERIEKWWDKNQVDYLRRYEALVYPNARAPRIEAPTGPTFDRSEWLVLLGRAAFFRMGRSTDDQHRSYIEYAQSRGWWRVFSAEKPERNAGAWMRVLDEFFDAQIEDQKWEHWTRWFSAIYKLSRWLDSYAELFLDLDRQDASYDLDSVLKPRADSRLQGGGIDAPPPCLGIGACFVVRELLRLKHIDNEHAYEHAFVPTKQIRDLLVEIGLDIADEPSVGVASQIYHQVAGHLDAQRARFSGAYDIPFRMIAEEPSLKDEILDGIPRGVV